MLNEGNFRENLMNMIDNPDSYTKEQYYEALLDMTERFLDELASTLTFEKSIINKCGVEKGKELIQYIASSNPALSDLERTYLFNKDQKAYIRDMLTYTECELGFSYDDSEGEL